MSKLLGLLPLVLVLLAFSAPAFGSAHKHHRPVAYPAGVRTAWVCELGGGVVAAGWILFAGGAD